LLEKAMFLDHLKNRKKPYIDLVSALAGEGDALTIDDATQAACDAATLARQHGHQVTLFINPWNVIHGQAYYFAQLSTVLDKTKIRATVFCDRQFDLESFRGKRILRERVKQQLLTIAAENERRALVRNLACALQVGDLSDGETLRVVSAEALVSLKGLGVHIANHGWTHAPFRALQPETAKTEVVQGREWIAGNLSCDAKAFAVPFGHDLPPFQVSQETYDVWFLNDELLYHGFVGPNIFNRTTLRL